MFVYWNLLLQPLLVLSCTFNLHSQATVIMPLLKATSNMTLTMTGIALNSQQQCTQTTLTTSLNKTDSQKPSFLDVHFPLGQKPNFLAIFSHDFPTDLHFDTFPSFNSNEYFLDTLPPSLPIPSPSPSEGYIVGATARLKILFNWLQTWAQTHQNLS